MPDEKDILTEDDIKDLDDRFAKLIADQEAQDEHRRVGHPERNDYLEKFKRNFIDPEEA